MSQVQQGPVHVELKPNRNLLDPNFDGYKLSLEKLPTYQVSVKTGLDRPQPSEQQYSLQHVKLFAVHNHIFSDSFNPFVVYIVDKLWTILRVTIDFTTGRLDVISEVWRVPKPATRREGRFNITLSFPDNGHAVVSDGCETLYILKTGDRKSLGLWTSILMSSPFSGKSLPQCCVLDSIRYESGNDTFFDVLALRIDEKNEWTDVIENLRDTTLSGHSFFTVLEWLTFKVLAEGTQGQEVQWVMKGHRTLLGHSGTEYAYLEPGGSGIYVASEGRFHVVADSEKPINLNQRNSSDEASGDAKKPEYLWSESMEQVKLWFKVPYSVTKNDVEVEFKPTSISVSYKKQAILEGPLSKNISVEGSYWIIDTPKCLPSDAPSIPEIQGSGDATDSKQYKVLEIVLEKCEKEVLWLSNLVTGNSSGEYISDPQVVEDIHARLAHLCSDKWGADPGKSDAYDPRQLEECDEYPADTSCLVRIDKHLQRISHAASLGSHQWLFNVRLESAKAPAICIRHDVDGIVWMPQLHTVPTHSTYALEDINWDCQHAGTFSALGYVQASKQQRKYTICASDVSYVAICDVKKHIYVYRQPAKIESCLRNRRTGEQVTHVAKQLVISLDPPHDILGAYATPSYLYVLTADNFCAIRILAEEE